MISLVARAYQLAPECFDIQWLRAKLRREGFSQVDAHLESASLRKDLRKLFQKAPQPVEASRQDSSDQHD